MRTKQLRRAESVRSVAARVRAGEITATEVCERALARAHQCGELGAFWHLDEEGALAAATTVDGAIAVGHDPGPLAGVPYAVKDAFDVAGLPGGGGGPVTVADRDAAAVRRLQEAGAVLLGKLAMHQLSWGMSGQTPDRPECRNPYAPGRQPGGSSSGSAVAVSAGIVPFALGADSGGSVRLPAAWCGVAGYKGSRAAISTDGLLPLSPLLDTVGVLAASVGDCFFVDAILRGGRERPLPPLDGLRLGVEERLIAESESAVAEAVSAALRTLATQGVETVPCELPVRAVPLAPIFAADLAAVWEDEVREHPEHYGEDVRRGVEFGAGIAAVEYLRAVARVEATREVAALPVDVLACPATPVVVPVADAPDDVRKAGRFARPFNLLDWPALVVPCGSSEEPVGLQLACTPGGEAALFALAAVAEQLGSLAADV